MAFTRVVNRLTRDERPSTTVVHVFTAPLSIMMVP